MDYVNHQICFLPAWLLDRHGLKEILTHTVGFSHVIFIKNIDKSSKPIAINDENPQIVWEMSQEELIIISSSMEESRDINYLVKKDKEPFYRKIERGHKKYGRRR